MKEFAYGFSSALATLAHKHRPVPVSLTYDNIHLISNMAGYNLIDRPRGGFTIYRADGIHGLDNGITVVWEVSASHDQLIYTPYANAIFYRGSDYRVTDAMEKVLSSLLYALDIQERFVVALPEVVVHIPTELRHSDVYTTVMFRSEFKEKYAALYYFMKVAFGD